MKNIRKDLRNGERERGEREGRERGKWKLVSNEMFAIMSVHLLCKLGHKTTTKQPKWLD